MDSVVHFEIPTDDLERAKKFYSETFGWALKPIPMPDGSEYCIVWTASTDDKGMLKQPGAINGGMMKRMHPGETPVLVINVPSVDEYIKKVEVAGGKVVMPKMQVMDMGYYARVTDTEGNVIGIWENIKK